MEWEKLLSAKRLRADPDKPDDARTPWLRDVDRIIFSSAFRRLQDKTQVFPLPMSDYVRTRLTHSVEASSVGRSMGAIVGKTIIERHELKNVTPADFGNIVSAACLSHDIGNPPFGHSGEDAIQHWCSTSQLAKSLLNDLDDRQRSDFVKFEGNAQGFRILTRLQNADSEGGLQLTCSTLAAFTKYPREAPVARDPILKDQVSMKKHGFFQREAEYFNEVAEEVGLEKRATPFKCWARHPLAFLVEAADDICYRVIDLEDGFRLGRVRFEALEDLLSQVIGRQNNGRLSKIRQKQDKVAFLRSQAINVLARQSAEAFLAHEKDILSAQFDADLISVTKSKPALDEIKEVSAKLVYSSPSVVQIEAAGFEVLGGLLETFIGAATDVATKGDGASSRSRKYMQLLPPRYSKQENLPYRRLLRITDYIAGMTDSFAVGLYKQLKGISLPSGR